MRKNDEIQLTIEDMGVSGEGIGKAEGMTFFVKDALIGDHIRAGITKLKKNYGYARLLEILTPSPWRVQPRCPIHRQCGGCQIQALDYKKQLEFKQKKVLGNLQRIGGFAEPPMEPVVGMEDPYHYRNKAQFPIGKDKDGRIIAGFYAGRTHQIIPNRDCALGVPVNKEILDIIIGIMEEKGIEPYDEQTRKGLVRHVLIRYGFHTKEIMVCIVVNGEKLSYADVFVKELCKLKGMTSISINVNQQNTNVIMGQEVKVLWGQPWITDRIGDISYRISPLSFYQVNPVQTEKLYRLALEYADLKGTETVWDLYCGIGTISLFLARQAKKVYGVEIVPQAIRDARENARINKIENVEFFTGKVEEILPDFYKKEEKAGRSPRADVIVVDPPRKGCDQELLDTILKMQPERIVYVSCDSATLARDLKILCQGEYELKRVRPVDQFCHTSHVETVCLLSNRKPDTKVRVDVDLEDYYRIKDAEKNQN